MIILHLSISAMVLIVQLLALCLVIAYSYSVLIPRKAFKFGFYMTLIAHTLGQMIIAGDARSFVFGLFILPLLGGGVGYAVAVLTKNIQNKMSGKQVAE